MANIRRRKRNRKRNRYLAIGVSVVFVLLLGIVVGQAIVNKKSNSDKSQVALATEANKSEKGENEKENKEVDKKGDKQPNTSNDKKEDLRKDYNVSQEGEKFTFSAEDAEKAREGKLPSDGKKVVFLTFDDGPSTTVTPKVLDTLKQQEVKATFFIVGKNLVAQDGSTINDKSANLLKREFEEGHAIANHSYCHDYSYLYPNRNIDVDRLTADFDKTNNIMKQILGEKFDTKVVRLPGGMMSWKNQTAAKEGLKAKNISYVDWNALNGDAEKGGKRPAEELIKRAESTIGTQEKVILLMHDTYGKETTAEALPKIIEHLKAQGYEFKTLK